MRLKLMPTIFTQCEATTTVSLIVKRVVRLRDVPRARTAKALAVSGMIQAIVDVRANDVRSVVGDGDANQRKERGNDDRNGVPMK